MPQDPVAMLMKSLNQQLSSMTANLNGVHSQVAQLLSMPLQGLQALAQGSGTFSAKTPTDVLTARNIFGA